MEPQAKRPKKPNFSDKETEVMMEEISVEAAVLMSALGTAVTNQKKQQIWANITEKVNAVGGNARTVEQVKKRWKDLKMSVLKWKQEASATGGGPAPPPQPYEDLVMGVLGTNTNLTSGIAGTTECDTWTAASELSVSRNTFDLAPQALGTAESGPAASPQPSTSMGIAMMERPVSTSPCLETPPSSRKGGHAKNARGKLPRARASTAGPVTTASSPRSGVAENEDTWEKYLRSQILKNEMKIVLMKEALEELKQRSEMFPLQKRVLELKIKLLEQKVSENERKQSFSESE
ncbi:hypothetical protein BaRGS_00005314 [Batillaria attramentaria]|uniref:Myb/SANT-like DNA-binding domain-containing protein n=1 Tax=Batillaria attramentaria TaxID=370345 RepID=A0ABD0LVH5_9CAEN